jgi:hypothetical protein
MPGNSQLSASGVQDTDRDLSIAILESLEARITAQALDFAGRGSWIRTNDLQYPKLPRYQAALYPECQAEMSIHARGAGSKA